MSEAISRRHFLGLGTGGGLALLLDQEALAQDGASSEPNPKLVSALKAYIISWYDVALKRQKEVPEEKRQNLEKVLAEQGFENPQDIVARLKDFKSTKELTGYFKQHGMRFFRKYSTGNVRGYPLYRNEPTVQRDITIFGEERTIPVTRIKDVLIPNFLAYAEDKGERESVRLGGYEFRTKTIELFPRSNYHAYAENRIYKTHVEEHEEIEKQLKDPDHLNQYIRRGAKPEFWEQLGRQLRHKGMRNVSTSPADRTTVIDKLTDDLEEMVVTHEGMHYFDFEDRDFSFAKDKGLGIKRELTDLWIEHGEIRGYLSGLYKYGLVVFGGMAKVAGDETLPKSDHNRRANEALFTKYIPRFLVKNRKKYPEIDLSNRNVYQIIRQLPKLGEDRMPDLAKGVFDSIYDGRTLMGQIRWYS